MKTRILHSLTIIAVTMSIAAWGAVEDRAMSRAGVIAVEQDTQRAQDEVNRWKKAETAKTLDNMTKGMQCKDSDHPFLTDKIVVTNDLPNLEWMTMQQALDAKGYTVVAYCK